MAIEVGGFAKEIHTGIRGKVTGRAEYINGRIEFHIQPPVDKEGKFVGGVWADERDLASIKASGKVSEETDADDASDDADEDEEEAPKKTRGKKTEDDESEDDSEDEDESDDEDEAQDSADDESEDESEEEDEEEKPKKSGKPKKLTIDDVNDACKKHAARSSVADTLAKLKKNFGVKSVSKLKPEQYEKAIKVFLKK